MDIISDDEERKIKPVTVAPKCDEMLNEAFEYIAKNSLKQAQIMISQYKAIISKLRRQPGLGRRYKDGMRRIGLGKFRYHIFYKEKETEIEIVGIWHTSRGTEFSEN
jgi:plasmid stabilization system protein ParE